LGTLPLPMHKIQPINVKRYPASSNRSLRAWSAADEYLVKKVEDSSSAPQKCIIYNDTFGHLAAHIVGKTTDIVWETSSQKGAIEKNLESNKKLDPSQTFLAPFDKPRLKPEIGVLKIPKSLDLFEFYLQHFAQHCSVKGELVCAFMTRHFSKQMLDIAAEYFEDITQSLAWKKSRLLILKNVKKQDKKSLIRTFEHEKDTISQYFGVFSSNSIDLGTQFLLDKLTINEDVKTVMDLGCGNGILGKHILQKNKGIDLHLVDDSYLALESAKLNVTGDKVHYHNAYTLASIADTAFDLIVSNPPFHVEHEIDISLPIRLFEEAHNCLAENGSFQLVANHHLNYKTHLDKRFSNVTIVAENEKYVVYNCLK
jgi:23S rRNA (guanine1835-N2)-methyltransferase